MRVVFSSIFLIFGIMFTIVGFDYVYMTAEGRVGAGFFPRWIGFALIIVSLYSVYKDIKIKNEEESEEESFGRNVKDMLIVLGLTCVFAILFRPLGSLLAIGLFVCALLFIFNRKKILQNILVSILFPLGIYLVFSVWLNSNLPTGTIFTMFS